MPANITTALKRTVIGLMPDVQTLSGYIQLINVLRAANYVIGRTKSLRETNRKVSALSCNCRSWCTLIRSNTLNLEQWKFKKINVRNLKYIIPFFFYKNRLKIINLIINNLIIFSADLVVIF